MAALIWSVIIVLFISSFIGLIIPLLPSSLLIWIGFFLYHFMLDGQSLSMLFWVSMGILTMFLFSSDMIANKYFVGRFGGSKWSEWGAIIALIIGLFTFPPYGIIVFPFLTVFVIEYLEKGSTHQAFKSAIGTLAAFFSSIFVKAIVQLMMIIWFLVVVLF